MTILVSLPCTVTLSVVCFAYFLDKCEAPSGCVWNDSARGSTTLSVMVLEDVLTSCFETMCLIPIERTEL